MGLAESRGSFLALPPQLSRPLSSLSYTMFCCVFFSFFFFFFFFFFVFSRATPAAYGGFQARGLIRAVAISLRHSHSNGGSELCLQPTPQLMAMLDP